MLGERLHQMVQSQPDEVALRDGKLGDVSYERLWQYVCGTAARISADYAGEKYLGIIADQDGGALIAAIAAMLSGKVIIPIDPRYDVALVEEMLLPFTHKILVGDIQFSPADLEVVPITELLVASSHGSFCPVSGNADAYILHTSGTTGVPKAVLADQNALQHVANALIERYYINKASKVLQFAYLSFDSSLIELWSTLLAGGTVVVAGQRLRQDMYGTLTRLIKSNEVNVLTLPSAVASHIDEGVLSKLETLILAGEEFPATLAEKLHDKVKHLINAYGPTESIICASTFEINGSVGERVPIGSPLPGMKMSLRDMDKDGIGEVVLTSDYLAKGYASQLHHARGFRTDENGVRSYMTGDLARQRGDGHYEFIGRVDNQIKLNGQRIELEGVEAVLKKVLRIDELAVVASSQKLYCAYSAESDILARHKISELLKDHLPEYMVPHRFVKLDSLPLDRNGKTDRREIQRLVADEQAGGLPIGNGKESVEATVLAVWSKAVMLPLNQIDRNSDFFELGGDSLSALRLVKLLNETFAIEVSLATVISARTPDAIVAVVERLQQDKA